MKLVKTLIAVAVTACAMNANAGLSFSQSAAVGFYAGPLTFNGTVSGTVNQAAVGPIGGEQAVPLGLTNSQLYTVIKENSYGILNFSGAGVNSFSFLWGSPDFYNFLEITSTGGVMQSFGGTSDLLGVGMTATGNNLDTRVFKITGDSMSNITSIKFRSEGKSFEIANALTPVPEPETYALMLAGLGAVGFLARRRRASHTSS